MKQFEHRLTASIASTPIAVLIGAAALVAIPFAFTGHALIPVLGNRGLAAPSPNLWLAASPAIALLVNLLALAVTAAIMAFANGRFSILRSYSLTFVSLFLVMTAATPSVACTFEGGALLAPVILLSMTALFSTYQKPAKTGMVFIAFLLPSAGTLVQYGFAIFIPVLLIGCAQMRVMNARSLMAALIGIATPWWLWWAFADVPTLHTPDFIYIFDTPEAANRSLPLMCTLGLTVATALVCAAANSLKILSFNARARAINGLLTIITIITLVMFFIDFTNLVFYITLMNVVVAFQVGHFFALYAARRSYLLMISLFVAYAAMFGWRLLTS